MKAELINRYKVVSGLMALAAVFLVIVGFKFISNNADFNLKNSTANLSFESDDDWDDDGLNNREESYWNTDPNNRDTDGDGYLDGEEVISGHNPTIQAPNDLIDDENLTSKLSGLALAGLYEGSLDPRSPNYIESINSLASSIAEDAVNKLDNKINARPKPLDSSKRTQEEYIKNISPVIEELFSVYITELKEIGRNYPVSDTPETEKELMNLFKEQSKKYDDQFKIALKIAPPTNWESNHVGLLKLLRDLSETHLAISRNNIDPITAWAAMGRLNSLLNFVPTLTEAYGDKVKSEKLDTRSTIFYK